MLHEEMTVMPQRAPSPRSAILVVDDDPSVREALAAALEDTYRVHTAATGGQALAILRRDPVAVIVLDALLGVEHGLDLVGSFRKHSLAPILVLTGHGSEDLAVRALRAGVNEYLKKPPDIPALQQAIDRLAGRLGWAPDPMLQIRRHLEERADAELSLAQVAGGFGLSEGHMRERFRQAFGKTPRRYLIELRLAKAAELLRGTGLSLAEIAHRVGLGDAVKFRRFFKAIYGVTPSAFRLEYQDPGSPERERESSGPPDPRN